MTGQKGADMKKRLWICFFLIAVLSFGACGNTVQINESEVTHYGTEGVDEIEDEDTPLATKTGSTTKKTTTKKKSGSGKYKAPELALSAFHEDLAQVNAAGDAWIDTSAANEGYVAVKANAKVRLKVQVVKEKIVYNYNTESDGTVSILPLQSGDGTYKIRILKNISGNKYAEMHQVSVDVKMEDSFQPYLHPSDYVSYDAKSNCVAKAQELAKKQDDALGVVNAVYDFICESITYDKKKAQTVQSGYLPYPDDTLKSGKGICFDYASLAAAMLRSQGIPTKLITGYVSPDGVYHAWNMFYTEQSGWVTVSYKVSKKSWNRIDLTFSANGADDTFIGDGGNYADLYVY